MCAARVRRRTAGAVQARRERHRCGGGAAAARPAYRHMWQRNRVAAQQASAWAACPACTWVSRCVCSPKRSRMAMHAACSGMCTRSGRRHPSAVNSNMSMWVPAAGCGQPKTPRLRSAALAGGREPKRQLGCRQRSASLHGIPARHRRLPPPLTGEQQHHVGNPAQAPRYERRRQRIERRDCMWGVRRAWASAGGAGLAECRHGRQG